MEKNRVPPPRLTSTPVQTGRNTVTFLSNFNEVSPIFSNQPDVRQTKSMIPVFKAKDIRSNGVSRFTGMEIKVSKTEYCTATQQISEKVLSRDLKKQSEVKNSETGRTLIPNEKGSTDCILKKSEKLSSGWQIPKETTNRLSLKRKPSIPFTVSKRPKRTVTSSQQSEESLFDSPELPNLVEVSSLCNKRQTYVIKKKNDMPSIHEEHHESVTDGIIPLQISSPENLLSHKSVTNSEEGTKKNKKERKTTKLSEQLAPKNELQDLNKDNENVEQTNSDSPVGSITPLHILSQEDHSHNSAKSLKRGSNKKTKESKARKQTEPKNKSKCKTEEKENVEQANLVSPTDSINPLQILSQVGYSSNKSVKSARGGSKKKTQETKTRKTLEPDAQPEPQSKLEEINVGEKNVNEASSPVDDQINKKNKKGTRQSKTQLKKNVNILTSGLVVNEIAQDEKITRPKRLLKPNIKYEYTESNDNVPNEISGKKKNEPIKLGEKCNENSSELPVDNKSQKRKPVKVNKKQSCAQPVSEELPLCHQDEIPEEVMDVCINNILKKSNGKKANKCLEKQEETNSASNKPNNCEKGNKTENKKTVQRRGRPKKNSKAPTEEKEEPYIEANQTNETGQKSCTLTDKVNLKLTANGSSFSNPSNEMRPAASETKIRRKAVHKVSAVKHSVDGNPSMKPSEPEAHDNTQPTSGKITKGSDGEKEETRRQVFSCTYNVKSKSTVLENNTDICKQSQDQKSRQTLDNKSNKMTEEETETSGSPSKKKRKSVDCDASHSESRFYFREKKYPPVEFWKNRTSNSQILKDGSRLEAPSKKPRSEELISGRETNSDMKFHIRDLLSMGEWGVKQVQPGVKTHSSIHISNFVMLGEVHIEPGSTLNKISSNSAYRVIEGTAQVKIKRTSKTFTASDEHPRFFIPKGCDASITNVENVALKMEFTKFRG